MRPQGGALTGGISALIKGVGPGDSPPSAKCGGSDQLPDRSQEVGSHQILNLSAS